MDWIGWMYGSLCGVRYRAPHGDNNKYIYKGSSPLKHCQRHNGPRVLSLQLELSCWPNKSLDNSLGPLCHHLNWLQIWPPDGATCIDYKFSHQVALLASVAILATRWCHLHQLKIRPQSGTTCIRSKFGHQMAPHAMVPKLAIRWRHLQM